MSRIVSWFSCGASSAVATKLAIESGRVDEIFYCEVTEEHPDNLRFLKDCENWFGQKITILGNDKFKRSADLVFRGTRFLVGPNGARCTSELKKSLRWKYGKPEDQIILGYTVAEKNRLKRILAAEPTLNIWPVLIEKNLTRNDCLLILERQGIELPEMYRLGYKNNNCIGCVKGGLGYWNKIRKDFPNRFDEMSKIERELGRTICRLRTRVGDKQISKRIYLDELPLDVGSYVNERTFECGIFCQTAEEEIS